MPTFLGHGHQGVRQRESQRACEKPARRGQESIPGKRHRSSNNHGHPETPGSGGGFNARLGLFFPGAPVMTFQNVSEVLALAQEGDRSTAPARRPSRATACFLLRASARPDGRARPSAWP
jgi:hypothetical protein